MTKSNKVVLAQPAATAPRLLPRAPGPVRGAAGGSGESHRARLRYQSLLQDYKDLLKETAAKKNRLHMEKLKKQRLLAEVKFLRRKHKSMSENPSQTVVYKVKNPAMGRPPSRTTVWDDRQRLVQAVGSSSRAPPAQQQQWHHPAPRPRASPVVIDLNEACELSSDDTTEEFHGYQRSVAAGPSDAKAPAPFWDVRNPAARAGKRKISWQDQLALRV
ncbi:uncharacterized protein LOC124682791 [Lolium rigidum]|uniref:uncharacterized protein LOC124682791 n=1 Tax=Lolium rigidum TaxID=89674 RepID=UPI001F5D4508|nr:uncharacterized protein LOC124682791 [Lolium rigidum]